MSFIIAIDGPAGTGKGTVANRLSEKLGFTNIGTGDAYRCVALYAIKNNLVDKQDELVKRLDQIEIKMNLEDGKVFLNGEEVTKEIRNQEVTDSVSQVSCIIKVRLRLNELFRELAKGKDVVMEGRDIATVVFPEADVKIYLDASEEVRAKRRVKQNKENNITTSYEDVLEKIKARDKNDKNKEFGALVVAKDAIVIDSTDLSIDEVIEKIENKIEEKNKARIEMTSKGNEEQNQIKEGKNFTGVSVYDHQVDSTWKKIQRRFAWHVLRGFYKLVNRVKIVGEENVPKEGSFILCGNHISFVKVPIIVMFTPRKVNFIGKEELFHNPALAWLGNLFDVISVKRGKQDVESMKKSLKVLSSGEVLGLFPEGTTNGLAKKVKVKNGAAFMALRTGKEVVPVGIKVTEGLFSKVIVNYGKPLDFSSLKTKTPEKEVLEKVTEEIMDNIIKLTNEAV